MSGDHRVGDKRAATTQLSRDMDDPRFAPEEEPKDAPPKASAEELAARRIVRVKRPEGGLPSASGLFANVASAAPAGPPKVGLSTRGFGGVGTPPTGPAAAPAAVPNPFGAKLATTGFGAAAAAVAPAAPAAAAAAAPSSLNAKPDGKGIPSVFGAGSSFKFSFTAPAPATTPAPTEAAAAPAAPAQQTVTLKHVEQEEDPNTKTAFADAFKLHQRVDGTWTDRGDVTVKVVTHSAEGAAPWALVGAFAAKTMRRVLSTSVKSLRLGARADRQVTFVCIEEGAVKPEMFVLRAPKEQDARVAAFVKAVEEAQKLVSGASA